MAVFTFEDEITSTVPPAKLYNALKDADSITPKIIDDVKSVEIVEGNGGPGTIKKLTIVEGGETKFILHKVEAIDEAKLYNAMKDADSITPKIIDDVKSVEIVEGNGGPGTIKKLNIVEGGETKFILHKVEAIDYKSKLTYYYLLLIPFVPSLSFLIHSHGRLHF
ncbi:hypothetical protein Ahy_A01g001027 [Arachis hypogaea]|uniref:Bet v I/Major latex protein domain-containing protein n=1 Tax=Arachis hypogaea TaxID=3818 RepID=A0A445ELU7_ARAHY|nr:hypothetical protein Ahy_A01g001027 [Arachis hypogaea]